MHTRKQVAMPYTVEPYGKSVMILDLLCSQIKNSAVGFLMFQTCEQLQTTAINFIQ